MRRTSAWVDAVPPPAALGAALKEAQVLRLGANCHVPELTKIEPDHMELVTDENSAPLWAHIADWIHQQLH